VIGVALAACGRAAEVDTEEPLSVPLCAAGATVHGVDVSAEAPVDWKAFSAGGWDFAIAKASEGVTFVEPQFAVNWPAMKAAGVVRGAYCFFHPSPDDPVQEADFFVATVNQAGGFELGDFAALDLETLDKTTAQQTAADALAFLERVKQDTGITPIIYTSPRVFDTLLGSPAGFAGYPLWDVTWNGGPPGCPNIPASWPGWAFWQYAGDSISAPGLPGTVNDGDVFNGTRDDLIKFGKSLWPQPMVDAGAPGIDAGVSDGDAGIGSPETGGTLTGGCDAVDPGAARPPLVAALVLVLALARRRRRRRTITPPAGP
jgi:lysozyme